jgi:hypothetical protein
MLSSGQYTITASGGTYTATENISPHRTASNANFASIFSTVLGWMTAGNTVDFIGNFTWSSTQVIVSKSIIMNVSTASINFATDSFPLKFTARVTMLGGHTVNISDDSDYNPLGNGGHLIGSGTSDRRILLSTGATGSKFDGVDFENFGVYFMYSATVSNVIIQNCIFHDFPASGNVPAIGGAGQGYHIVQDCRFLRMRQMGIFLEGTNTNCQFLRNEFRDFEGVGNALYQHCFYLSGGSISGGVGGYNTIAYNKFSDMDNYGGAVQIKCPSNKIYGNTFENYTSSSVAISIYSQFAGSGANNNEIYNNTFTNVGSAFWIGKNDAVEPTLQTWIHNNTFTNVNTGVWLLLTGAISNADDTKVYYNDFNNCNNPILSQTPTLVHNTVFAFNYLNANMSTTQLQNCVNSMCYQNTFFPPNSTTLAIPNFNFVPITESLSYYYVAPRI